MIPIFSYRKLIFLTLVGIASFIFFGLFLPIILSNAPIKLTPFFFKISPTPGPSRPPVSLKGITIIQSILSQIEGFRLNSSYTMAMHCLREKEKKEADESEAKVESPVLLGRCDPSVYRTIVPPYLVILLDRFSGVSGESAYRMKADEAFAEVVRLCNFNRQMCVSLFPALVWRLQNYQDETIRPLIEQAGEGLFAVSSASVGEKILEMHKLITLYRLTQDPSFVAASQARLASLTKVDKKQDISWQGGRDNPLIGVGDKDQPIYRFDCGRWWIEAELARITNNQDQFAQAQKFFKNIDKYAPAIGHIGGLTMCLEGLSYLERETGQVEFRDLARTLVELGLTRYWDSAYDPKFTGDYGILLLDYWDKEANRMLNFKYLNETVWFVSHALPFSRAMLTF